jgi:flagellar basal body P-ring formation protein FlgA
MIRGLAALALMLAAVSAAAQTVTPVRTIRSQTVIAATDLTVTEPATPGALTAIEDALGMEARVTLYAGRPILIGQIGPPARVERNQLVRMTYVEGALSIIADGRTLDRAAAGEFVRVMNLTSRQIVSGLVLDNGTVKVTR